MFMSTIFSTICLEPITKLALFHLLPSIFTHTHTHTHAGHYQDNKRSTAIGQRVGFPLYNFTKTRHSEQALIS